MLQVGVDAHKALLVVVATDSQGRQVASWQGENRPHDWQMLASWANALDPEHVWGIEGSGHYGRGLAQWLLAHDEVVYEVNPRWVAQHRRRQRQAAKTDLTDGLAIARLLGQEGATLPAVTADDASSLVGLLTRERQALLNAATRARNQLHVHLFQLDPSYRQHYPNLTRIAVLERLRTLAPPADDVLGRMRVRSVQRLAARLLLLSAQAAELKTEIEALAPVVAAPLLTIRGVGPLTAGMLAGYLGPGQRFASDAQLAAYAGVAPLETSSAGQVRHRLNRTGQRQVNALLHRIAITQVRCDPEPAAYMARRQAEGKTEKEALRALKRHIAREVWRQWQRCHPPPLT